MTVVFLLDSSRTNEPWEPRDLAGACSGGKFFVAREGEAYNPPARNLNRKFWLTPSRAFRAGWFNSESWAVQSLFTFGSALTGRTTAFDPIPELF